MLPALQVKERELMESDSIGNIGDGSVNPPISYDERKYKAAIESVSKPRKSDALGLALLGGPIVRESKRGNEKTIRFKPVQHSSDGLVYENGIWRSNGNIIPPGSAGGAMPPPGGAYYQTRQPGQPDQQPGYNDFFSALISGLFTEVKNGMKENLYRALTQWPLSLRDVIFSKANAMGSIFDWGTSIPQLGWHNGPVQATIDDYFYDRLELVTIKETNELVGMRSVNTRPETGIAKILRSPDKYGRYVPRGGRSVDSLDDLIFSREGLITGYNLERCGGYPLTEIDFNYDEFFTKNNTLEKISHGESKTPGLDTKELENMLKEFMLYLTVIREFGGQRKNIGSREFPDIGKTYTYERILMDDWKTINPNYILGLASRGIGAYLFAHPMYSLMEKLAGGVGWASLKRDIEQRELRSMFIPPEFVIKRFGYG
jgi:hypothetical protein